MVPKEMLTDDLSQWALSARNHETPQNIPIIHFKGASTLSFFFLSSFIPMSFPDYFPYLSTITCSTSLALLVERFIFAL